MQAENEINVPQTLHILPAKSHFHSRDPKDPPLVRVKYRYHFMPDLDDVTRLRIRKSARSYCLKRYRCMHGSRSNTLTFSHFRIHASEVRGVKDEDAE